VSLTLTNTYLRGWLLKNIVMRSDDKEILVMYEIMSALSLLMMFSLYQLLQACIMPQPEEQRLDAIRSACCSVEIGEIR
jgi:heme/copper-type cytochrome/quinol oxidase subunit 1